MTDATADEDEERSLIHHVDGLGPSKPSCDGSYGSIATGRDGTLPRPANMKGGCVIGEPDVIGRYFEADARRDTDSVVGLFTEDAVVVDESRTWRGVGEIRAWRKGPVSQYEYTTEVFDTVSTGQDEYLVTGRLEGNFPGGTVDVTWRFTVLDNRISHLHIA
jgi:hypothetical protein